MGDRLARGCVRVVFRAVRVAIGDGRGGVVDMRDEVGGRESAAVDTDFGFFILDDVAVFFNFPSLLFSSPARREDLRTVRPHVVLEPESESRVVDPADWNGKKKKRNGRKKVSFPFISDALRENLKES